MTEVIPGIHWLKLPIPMPESTLTHANAYLVQGDSGHLLVDTGWNTDETLDSLQKQLAEIGVAVTDISLIIGTHGHPDHYGLAGRLKELSGAQLALHDIEKGFIEPRHTSMQKSLEQTDHWLGINGLPPEELQQVQDAPLRLDLYVAPANPDIAFQGGETISTGMFTFQVLWTPGHSPGHICLYEPEKKVLIAGDHILPTITPNISKRPQQPIENPLGMYLDSLNDLRKMDIELVLPGHEDLITDPKQRIDELFQHHENRIKEILATIQVEAKTAYQIATKVTWGNGTNWHDLHFHDKRMAIAETLAHLELMLINGQISEISRDSVIYYQKN
jgi:glyoxylase-like metal-dependent hydrolase (beta-lactamase superfamily II)